MKINENHCKIIKKYENPWKYMKKYENGWKSMKMCARAKLLANAAHGEIWRRPTVTGIPLDYGYCGRSMSTGTKVIGDAWADYATTNNDNVIGNHAVL